MARPIARRSVTFSIIRRGRHQPGLEFRILASLDTDGVRLLQQCRLLGDVAVLTAELPIEAVGDQDAHGSAWSDGVMDGD